MSFDVSINGFRCHEFAISQARTGAWTSDVTLDDEATIADGAKVTLVVGDLSLVGFARRGGAANGVAHYLLSAGGGGWSKVLPARAYRSDAGVRPLTVLSDLTRECGETIFGAIPTAPLGTAFARLEQPAIRTLRQVLGSDGFFVDDLGRVQIGARPASTFSGEVLDVQLAERSASIATDSPARVRPGCTVAGIGVVDRVEISGGSITVWGAP